MPGAWLMGEKRNYRVYTMADEQRMERGRFWLFTFFFLSVVLNLYLGCQLVTARRISQVLTDKVANAEGCQQ